MRTEAIVESFEASLREAFQQLQGGANAIPWWERKSLAQGMTESFVVGTASESPTHAMHRDRCERRWFGAMQNILGNCCWMFR